MLFRSRSDCCNSTVPSPCNEPWYLDRALTRTNNYVSMTGAVTFDQVRAEIDAGRPVGARIGWSGQPTDAAPPTAPAP